MARATANTNLANGDERERDVDPKSDSGSSREPVAPLEEGVDYYLEDGLFVFTAEFLKKRGYCCDSGCRNCPYPKQ